MTETDEYGPNEPEDPINPETIEVPEPGEDDLDPDDAEAADGSAHADMRDEPEEDIAPE